MKPNGELILTFPFHHPMHEVPNDFTRWTEFGIKKILNDHNLKIEKMMRRGGTDPWAVDFNKDLEGKEILLS